MRFLSGPVPVWPNPTSPLLRLLSPSCLIGPCLAQPVLRLQSRPHDSFPIPTSPAAPGQAHPEPPILSCLTYPIQPGPGGYGPILRFPAMPYESRTIQPIRFSPAIPMVTNQVRWTPVERLDSCRSRSRVISTGLATFSTARNTPGHDFLR